MVMSGLIYYKRTCLVGMYFLLSFGLNFIKKFYGLKMYLTVVSVLYKQFYRVFQVCLVYNFRNCPCMDGLCSKLIYW